jgi:hypothetical protein
MTSYSISILETSQKRLHLGMLKGNPVGNVSCHPVVNFLGVEGIGCYRVSEGIGNPLHNHAEVLLATLKVTKNSHRAPNTH